MDLLLHRNPYELKSLSLRMLIKIHENVYNKCYTVIIIICQPAPMKTYECLEEVTQTFATLTSKIITFSSKTQTQDDGLDIINRKYVNFLRNLMARKRYCMREKERQRDYGRKQQKFPLELSLCVCNLTIVVFGVSELFKN